MNWKIGVIGFGNMAQAMIGGWIKCGAIDKNNVYVCADDSNQDFGNFWGCGHQ